MKNFMGRKGFGLLVMVLLMGMILPATAMAQRGPHHDEDGDFTNPRNLMEMADELELDEDQRASMRELLEEHRGEIQPLRREMREEGQKLREMMRNDSSRAEVMRQLEEVLELEARVKRGRTTLMLDMRELLTEEQQARAQERLEGRGQELRERRQHRRQNRGQDRGNQRQQRRGL